MADLRKCIGSAKFGIEAHEAPAADFPAQPSQKDGLGRMCKAHWTEYARALRAGSMARKAGEAVTEAPSTILEMVGPLAAAIASAKPARQAAAQHVELLDPPVSRQRGSRAKPAPDAETTSASGVPGRNPDEPTPSWG